MCANLLLDDEHTMVDVDLEADLVKFSRVALSGNFFQNDRDIIYTLQELPHHVDRAHLSPPPLQRIYYIVIASIQQVE
jgi:hypothetical protein